MAKSAEASMTIWIVGDFTYPNGYGATARVHAYAKGLMANGVDVRVLPYWPNNLLGNDTGAAHTIENCDNAPCDYACATTVHPTSFWRSRVREIEIAWKLWRLAYSETQEKRPDAILLYADYAIPVISTVILCWLVGAKCIQDRSEFPFVYGKKTLLRRIYASIYTTTIYRLLDGIIVISTYLERYFAHRVRRGARILRIPIMVSLPAVESRFGSDSCRDGQRRITYMGDFFHPGEVPSVIRAFSQVADEYPGYNLQIIGDTTREEIRSQLRKLVVELHLTERVEFTGTVGRNNLARYLYMTDVFVLPRASGTFSSAGFPTKLGEYLITGRPVVVTSTGDIPLYLQDRVSAYLVPPDDQETFVLRLKHVLAHPEEAAEVGQRGREIALRAFDPCSNCARLITLLKELQENGVSQD